MNKFLLAAAILVTTFLSAQTDSTEKWSWHYQFTGIMQGHPGFHASYAGQNSLDTVREKAFSVTSTFFLGRRLWKGGEFYLNPEIAGGKGISSALGIAGFTNGECFRIGDPSPAVYLARVFLRQYIWLGPGRGKKEAYVKPVKWNEASANQLAGWVPVNRITITAGKFSIADVYDNNSYSHDPRTQFMNWSLMSNGAWDYPANTRGYTWGVIADLTYAAWSVRLSGTMIPKTANGSVFDHKISKANGASLEIERRWGKENHEGAVRLLGFRNVSRAGNYQHAIEELINGTDSSMNVNTLSVYGGSKMGFGINAEQALNAHIGIFMRAGWNDGKTATWVFTEIDQNVQAGIQVDGSYWKRKNDVFGVAFSMNGISKDHIEFLDRGGYGFIIGDGKLTHYGMEQIAEAYYSAQLTNNLWLSADYQFVNNPAYNEDRGPVHVWAIRGHVAF